MFFLGCDTIQSATFLPNYMVYQYPDENNLHIHHHENINSHKWSHTLTECNHATTLFLNHIIVNGVL